MSGGDGNLPSIGLYVIMLSAQTDKPLRTSDQHCAMLWVFRAGGSSRQRRGMGGVLYTVCAGLTRRVRVCARSAVHGASEAQTRLL